MGKFQGINRNYLKIMTLKQRHKKEENTLFQFVSYQENGHSD